MSTFTEHDSDFDLEESTDKPKLYKVIMLNDHFTTMDFVVSVLVKIFRKDVREATAIMFDIHQKGAGLCGIFPKDIAVTKVSQVHKEAKANNFPLKCKIESE